MGLRRMTPIDKRKKTITITYLIIRTNGFFYTYLSVLLNVSIFSQTDESTIIIVRFFSHMSAGISLTDNSHDKTARMSLCPVKNSPVRNIHNSVNICTYLATRYLHFPLYCILEYSKNVRETSMLCQNARMHKLVWAGPVPVWVMGVFPWTIKFKVTVFDNCVP